MARIINASINLNKVGKDKIFVTESGKYINISISVNDEVDKYDNDVSITLRQSKDEREAKEKKIYVGNGKTVWRSDDENGTQTKNNRTLPQDDGLPY